MPASPADLGKLIQGKMEWSDFTNSVQETLKDRDWYDEKLVQAAEEPKKLFDEIGERLGSRKEINNVLPSLLFMRRHYLRQRNSVIPSSDSTNITEKAPKSVKGGRERLLGLMYRYMRLLDSMCTQDAEGSGIAPRDVLSDRMRDMEYKPELPRHTVFIDHIAESVVVIMQGTSSAYDVIKDLVADTKLVLNDKGYSHKGMADGAELMLEEVMPQVVRALQAYPSYGFTAVGHSLGAGVAIMMALTLRNMDTHWDEKLPEGTIKNMQVIAFAPPPLWAPLSELTDDDIRGIHILANNVDMIPRATLRSMELLVSTVKHIDEALEGYNPMHLFQTLCNTCYDTEVDDKDAEKCEDEGNGQENDEECMKVSERIDRIVAEAVQEVNENADKEHAEGNSGWLHRQLYHPCPVLHMYPVLSEDMEDGKQFTHGRTAEVPRSYRLHEIEPREFAKLPTFEGDGFVNDHLTEPIMQALLRLDNGKTVELKSHAVQ
mmetsp:Transcript_32432/g.91907  ORF Transcript_32432/g.91907 Transcript_32432/m.91907 type:complete len:489 (+) Transcript_32432:209-1675(+)|eukprot:CAMPEP_0117675750 /NCGR_PEP_ID=MMETSP0804-20121206/15782_1 /TAXON_ID=1074897 /ORGANISM="Tetraselmis astigmatica, Strain CCMP880" /LENGTH=488 /DNA_ID=CAMNT_0005484795 /DNA_START=110 /DNA_END=1576 /DNA_ORIENTATION=-